MMEQTRLDEEPRVDGAATVGCSVGMGAQFDPFGAHAVEPHAFYARARAQEPVFYSPVLDMWVVTGYDDIVAVLRDPGTYSSRDSIPTAPRRPGESGDIPDLAAGGLIRVDPPEHTRQRKAYAQAFTPARVNALEPMIREVADDLIDQMIDRTGTGPADLVAQFAYPLPLTVILRVLGVPVEDLEKCRAWTENLKTLYFAPHLSADERAAAARGADEFMAYTLDLVASRARESREDFVSHVLSAPPGDHEPLSIEEVADALRGFIFAGHETTANLIGNLIWRLVNHPDQLAHLRDHPAALPAAVEEGLRYDPSRLGFCRTTNREVRIAGVAIPAGARLLLSFVSGNRDERRFLDSDRFDVGRVPENQHLAFGRGIHFCFGAPLARLETRIALERLLARLPGLRAADPDADPRRQRVFNQWAWESLPIAWDS